MKPYPTILLVIIILAFSYIYFQDPGLFSGLAPTTYITSDVNHEAQKEYTSPATVYFCPEDDCASYMLELIEDANKIHCALYDLDLPVLIDAFKEKSKKSEVLLFTDTDNQLDLPFEKSDDRSSLMHNKFCVFDDKLVWTGSFNPTYNGNYKNNNNVVVLESPAMAAVFESEFQELWNYQDDVSDTSQFNINNMPISVYFCPEDWCANKVMLELNKAASSIYFMTFSFTHDLIGDVLVKKHGEGVHVEGIFESRGISKYSEFDKLNQSNITVFRDTNPNTMHHKVFIIDEKTVITGSFNPTRNADERNDENLLIIHDEDIAALFLSEYYSIPR